MLHYIPLEEMAQHYGIEIPMLKEKTYAELELMEKKMNEAKFLERKNYNAEDEEYRHIVLKYFMPVKFLESWFTLDEIVLACADTGVEKQDICEEHPVVPGKKCGYDNSEYLRTSFEYVRQYTKDGRELANMERQKMDVYRVPNGHQSIKHGDVILKLLYDRYPELKEFDFSAYGMDYGSEHYEIYPKNGIYTNFTALMTGNIDHILYRNREYCKLYNNGRYSPEECEKAFRTENALKMFDCIRRIGYNEKELGHSPIRNEKGSRFIDSMEFIMESDGMSFFKRLTTSYSRNFVIWTDKSVSVEHFLDTYVKFMKGYAHMTELSICLETDYLTDNKQTVVFDHEDVIKRPCPMLVLYDAYEGHNVTGCFGCITGGRADLVIRVAE